MLICLLLLLGCLVLWLLSRQIYDDSGQKLLHSYKRGSSGGAAPSLKEQHLRGIACDGKESLFIGTGAGELLVFALSKAKFSLVKSLAPSAEGHGEGGGISAIAFSATPSPQVISGDDSGQVVFWSFSGGVDAMASVSCSSGKITKLEGKGVPSPVNVLATGHGLAAGGFASGHVRLYDLAKRQLVVEIGAHSRAINGLDIHATRPLLVAAAEDTFVTCWSLPTAALPSVRNLMAESPALGLLTGCSFGGANQELIVSTIYDSRSLALLHTP